MDWQEATARAEAPPAFSEASIGGRETREADFAPAAAGGAAEQGAAQYASTQDPVQPVAEGSVVAPLQESFESVGAGAQPVYQEPAPVGESSAVSVPEYQQPVSEPVSEFQLPVSESVPEYQAPVQEAQQPVQEYQQPVSVEPEVSVEEPVYQEPVQDYVDGSGGYSMDDAGADSAYDGVS
ncbi:hypothetical protein OG389_00475 [Streptomyces sp. NBC_00435]|uniref:hypothetical protein n=1 Tax=Streptomyces sp. NBC_00435 TaxID=2903649 RepID=UPI002E1A9CC3